MTGRSSASLVVLLVLTACSLEFQLEVAASQQSSLSRTQALQTTAEALAGFIGRQSGWSPNLTKLSSISFQDAKVQHVLTYDFGLRVDGKQKEFSLSEEVSPWSYVVPALPPGERKDADSAATTESGAMSAVLASSEAAAVEQGLTLLGGKGSQELSSSAGPSLPPFVLEGPVELWIEGVTQLRLAMPHDVDAGDVRKVVLAPGAAVTVVGCKEVSLARPLQLPLPLKLDVEDTGVTKGAYGPLSLYDLASKLRKAAYLWAGEGEGGGTGRQSRELLALRIVKPATIVAASPSTPALSSGSGGIEKKGTAVQTEVGEHTPDEVVPRLRVKRLSPSSVELQARNGGVSVKGKESSQDPGVIQSPLALWSDASAGTPRRVSLWPFAFHNASHACLSGFQEALVEALGSAARRQGNFRLTRASAAVRKVVSVPFEVELQTTGRVGLSTMLLGQAAEEEGQEKEQEEVEGHAAGHQKEKDRKGRQRKEGRPLVRQQWEVLLQEGKGGDLQPFRLKQVDSVQPTVVISPGLVTGNGTALLL